MVFEEPCDFRWSIRCSQKSIQDCSRFRDLRFVFRRFQNPTPGLRLLLNEVVNQANAIAFPHRLSLVLAVGIEGDVGKLGGVDGVGIDRNFPPRMTNPQCAAAIRRGECHDQRAEHPIGFLGVPVGQKEAATVVHKQLVEFGGDTCVFTSQPCLHFREDGLKVRRPGFSGELDLVGSDLPHLAYGRIDDRRLGPCRKAPVSPAAQSPRSARRVQETKAFRRLRPPPSASVSPPCRRRKSRPAASRATEQLQAASGPGYIRPQCIAMQSPRRVRRAKLRL